jgi:hypothetical protein
MWDVATLRYREPKRLTQAFPREVLLQLLPQMTNLNSDYIVLIRIEIRAPPKGTARDLILADGSRRSFLQRTADDVQEDVAELRGLGKLPAPDDPLRKEPTLITLDGHPIHCAVVAVWL